jgi:hypothetical protein
MIAGLSNRADLASDVTTDLSNIAYIVNRYNDTTKIVTSEIHFNQSSTTVTKTLRFPELERATQPTARLLQMRQKVTALYAGHFATSSRAVGDVLLFSARHPWRSAGLPPGDQLDVLVGLIGTYSIVESVTLTPGLGYGTLIVATDQNEAVIFEVLTSGYRGGNDDDRSARLFRSAGTYDFTYAVDLNSSGNQLSFLNERDDRRQPTLSEQELSVSRADVLDVLATELAGFTQMEEIDDFPNKFLDFMTDNRTTLQVGDRVRGSAIDHSLYRCFNEEDTAVITAFLEEFITANQYQIIPGEETIKIEAPIEFVDESRSVNCSPDGRIFFDM